MHILHLSFMGFIGLGVFLLLWFLSIVACVVLPNIWKPDWTNWSNRSNHQLISFQVWFDYWAADEVTLASNRLSQQFNHWHGWLGRFIQNRLPLNLFSPHASEEFDGRAINQKIPNLNHWATIFLYHKT